MKNKGWESSDIKSLFLLVEKCKLNNKNLLLAFKEFAQKNNRSYKSIRNYYYKELIKLKENPNFAKNLGINLENHITKKTYSFTEYETKSLVKEILRQKCLGISVRKACLNISNNNIKEMIRCQNKFRSILKNNKKLYNDCLNELRQSGLKSRHKTSNNVIFMQKKEQKILSDDDINSLVLGLIKLVRKSAIENAQSKLIEQSNSNSNILRNTTVKLAKTEKALADTNNLLTQRDKTISVINEENLYLKTQLANLLAEKYKKSYKNVTLLNYLREMKNKGNNIKTKI